MRRGRSSENFDPRMMAESRGERRVASEQWRAEGFRQSDVRRIVSGQIVAQFPNPGQEEVMRVAGQREIRKILQRLKRARGVKIARARIATEDLRNLEIQKVRRMKRFVFGEESRGDETP